MSAGTNGEALRNISAKKGERMKKIGISLLVAGLVILTTCVTEDTTNPQVSIVSPANNDTIAAGNILIKAYATDNKEVVKVEFYIDNSLAGTDQAGVADTFRYTWDASAITPGSAHTIHAKAYDAADNSATSSTITIVIAGGGGGSGPTHHSGEISQDETWYPSGNPHIIDSDVYPGENVTLTIKPGCVIKFKPGTELFCGYYSAGAIVAEGTADSIILFTSYNNNPQPGDWEAVGVYQYTMSNASFRYCTFEYGGGASDYGTFTVNETGVKMSNCTVKKSADYGIVVKDNGYFREFNNNTITECIRYPLSIEANYARTIGNGNSFTGNTQDGIWITLGQVTTSGTWLNPGVPYVITRDVVVQSNANNPVLTIAPGTTIKLQPDVEFYCGWTEMGAIKADGTAGRIRFISSVPAPNRGDWRSIGFYQYTIDADAKLINCTIEYGGGDDCGNIRIDDALPEIRGDSIGHSAAYGIYLEGTTPSPSELRANNTFYDCESGDIREP